MKRDKVVEIGKWLVTCAVLSGLVYLAEFGEGVLQMGAIAILLCMIVFGVILFVALCALAFVDVVSGAVSE